ncbi:MAG: sugar transferase [Chloroflexi bacterium]|nr:sugar transferase [Chloroflexota bacterium]
MQYASRIDSTVKNEATPASYVVLKRGMDIIGSLLCLVGLAPVLLACAVAVRLDSPGPILFRQQRVGQGGTRFTMLKLRTMYANAPVAPHQAYAAQFIQGRAEVEQSAANGPRYKLTTDPRVTRIGAWLRRTSLDELPQLWNVLRGDMSLVGPRPPIGYELNYYQDRHFVRLAVKPGITGLWQVEGRSSTTFEEMVALDLDYVQARSFLRDCLILCRTVPVVLARSGA